MSVFSAVFEKNLFTIQRSTPGTRDALGRPTTTWRDVATVDGLLIPSGSSEGEAFVVDKFRSLMAYGTDFRAADRVLAAGAVYTVEGTPFSSKAPTTSNVGVVQAVLKYVGPVTP